MDLQIAFVGLIVALAVGYLLGQTWRTWSGRKSGCGGGCSCDAKAPEVGKMTLIPAEQITVRRRKDVR